jgi:hypothetical protein
MSAFAREELLGHVPGFNGAAGPPQPSPDTGSAYMSICSGGLPGRAGSLSF